MTDTTRLAGKVALVTGGGAGIGEACCRQLAAEGAQIAVADLDEAAGRRVAESVGGAFFRCDVTDPAAMAALVDSVAGRFGGLDIAVNNAGIAGEIAPLTEYKLETWDRVLATNLSGVFYGLRAQIPAIAARGGGAIVNIASTMGVISYPGICAYVAAKHGVVGLTKAAALEAGPLKVRVTAVAPSFIRTKLTEGALPEEAWDALTPLHALNRCATPAEVAKLVAFLASGDAAYITGSCHMVDGGYTAA